MAPIGLNKEAGQQELAQAVQAYKDTISHIRTGVASLEMVRDIKVEAYGTAQPLEHVSTVSIMSGRSLSIKPWDNSLLQAIHDSVHKSRPDYEITVKPDQIIINLPVLTEESRKEYVKMLKDKTEQFRQRVRDIRHKMRDYWQNEKENMPENDYFRALEEVDKQTAQTNQELEDAYNKKSEELLKV